jgi:hypothetical protein
MRDGARGGLTPDTPPCETLVSTSSRPNSAALAARVVLTHPRAAFYIRTCELSRGTATVAAALIDYDDMEVATRTTVWRR